MWCVCVVGGLLAPGCTSVYSDEKFQNKGYPVRTSLGMRGLRIPGELSSISTREGAHFSPVGLLICKAMLDLAWVSFPWAEFVNSRFILFLGAGKRAHTYGIRY